MLDWSEAPTYVRRPHGVGDPRASRVAGATVGRGRWGARQPGRGVCAGAGVGGVGGYGDRRERIEGWRPVATARDRQVGWGRRAAGGRGRAPVTAGLPRCRQVLGYGTTVNRGTT